ncbi:CvpA family protein [Patescibacteria group bacterium]|nr:CvpA family protein [Patescibacteria group bacterium]
MDLVLLVLLGGFIALGFMTGLFQTLGSVLGIFVGYFIAAQYYEAMGAFLTPIFMGNEQLSNMIAFLIIFIIVNRLIGLMVWVFAKTFKLLNVIPFFSILNRLGGAVLGFIEGIFVLGVALLVIEKFQRLPGVIEQMSQSDFAQLLLGVGSLLEYIYPTALSALGGVI